MVSYRVNYLIPINISGLSEQTHNTRIPLTANTSRCRHSVAQLIHIRRTGRLGNVGYVGYYWTRSVVPTNRWYRYARYLGFGDYSVHAEFANVERSTSSSTTERVQ
jgi:hypothetical protein